MVAACLTAILSIVYRSAGRVISEKDDALYGERLDAAVAQVASEQANLERTGLAGVEAYVQGAQKSALEGLAARHGKSAAAGAAFFILDRDRKVVHHPTLPAGASIPEPEL